MKMSQGSAIGRSVDPTYPTNRAIILVTLVVVAGGAVFQWLAGAGLLQGGLWGVEAGLAAFLGWALCRELDPDHDLSAFVAAGLTVVGLFWGQPDLLVLFWVLMIVRVVNRSVGLPATLLDALVVVGSSGWLMWQRSNWVYGVVAGLAFLLDGQLPKADREQRAMTVPPVAFAAAAIIATGAWVVLRGRWWPEAEGSAASALAVSAMSAIFVPVIVGASRVSAVDDRAGEPLEPTRVQAAQGMAVLTGVQIGLWAGRVGIVSVAPLWAAAVGAALYRLAVGPLVARFLEDGRSGGA